MKKACVRLDPRLSIQTDLRLYQLEERIVKLEMKGK